MKIAVVGCGQIADAHVMEALKIPQVNIVGVCDQNWHMADQLAVRFSLRPFTDLVMCQHLSGHRVPLAFKACS